MSTGTQGRILKLAVVVKFFSGKEESVTRFHVHGVTFNAVRGCDKNISKCLGNKTTLPTPPKKTPKQPNKKMHTPQKKEPTEKTKRQPRQKT